MFAILLFGLTSGCTHLRPVVVNSSNLPSGVVLPHHAALVLDQSLADFKYEFHNAGDTWVYPYGPALTNYARQVVGKCFQQVEVVPSVEQAAALASADLILIPRAVKFDRGLPATAFGNVNATLVLEWTAKDRASQNTIWLKTITADVSSKYGSMFSASKHEHLLNQKLFDDLNLKTCKAFQEAAELR